MFCLIVASAVLEHRLLWTRELQLKPLPRQEPELPPTPALVRFPLPPAPPETEEESRTNESNAVDDDFFHTLFDSSSSERERMEQNFSFFFDARDARGRSGYIADPKSLRRGVKHFLATRANKSSSAAQRYFQVLQRYEAHYRAGTATSNMKLDENATCFAGESDGPEKLNGFKLLYQKIQIAPASNTPNNNNSSNHHHPKLLCMVYTYGKGRDMARAVALSWVSILWLFY